MSARGGVLSAVAISVVSALGIALVQPGLATNVHKLREREDVFLLPPPGQLRALSLGYHAAAADLLWAKMLVEYGLHGQEKRKFSEVTRYIDGIIALEPDFPPLYEFVDTILVYTPPPGGTAEDARTARRYLERGMRERPYDAMLAVHAGQFIAFIAPTFLKDEQEIETWRLEGARIIATGIELGGGTHGSLAATTILGKSGETKAKIEHLQRAYAMSDNVEERAQFLRHLRLLAAEADAEAAISAVDREIASYRFLSRTTGLLIGPRRSATRCAGPGSYERPACVRDWQALIDNAK